MKKMTKIHRRRAVTRAAEDKYDRTAALSLNDLQVPVRPLLSSEEEARAGRRIQSCLRRLEFLLPRHPLGYQRYLDRMDEVATGGGSMFPWVSLRQQMTGDLEVAREALGRATAILARGGKTASRRAARALEPGVEILASYPLDPETRLQWSVEVAAAAKDGTQAAARRPFDGDPRFEKIDRILRRVVRKLVRQRDVLVVPNFRLVLKDVFRYHPAGMRYSDLFQEGVLGLQKAALRYDPLRGTRFSTYATYWIRQSIRKALIDKARMIRVPQAVQEELRKPAPKLDTSEVARVRRIMGETMLFSAAESDEGGDRNSFVVSDRRKSAFDEELHTTVIPSVVTTALDSLDTRSREVLQRRFGLGGEHPETLEEIGKRMSLSRERIRQIERDALRRMQRRSDLQEAYEDLGEVELTVR